LNEIAEDELLAVYSLTGMETSPKEMEAFPSALALTMLLILTPRWR
jgi:hypothetical protein